MFAVLQLGRPKLRELASGLVEEEEPHGGTDAVDHRKGAERDGRGQLSPLCLSCRDGVVCGARRSGVGVCRVGLCRVGIRSVYVQGRYICRVRLVSAGR